MKILHVGSGLSTLVTSIAATLVVSCKGPQQLYQENLLFKDSAAVIGRTNIQFEEPKIQVSDLLYIQVQTADARTNQLFNSSQLSTVQGSTASLVQGYQVGSDSTLSFPVLGKLKAAGLSRFELEKELTTRVEEYIKAKPSVQVRYLNYKVTVLGEVQRPGSFSFPTDRVTIIDALGTAGDIGIFGRRDKVWIIRENSGRREFLFVNLQDSKTFNPQSYFLKQNDVIYVEPTSRKFIQADPTYNRTTQNISIGLSSIGLIIALVSLLR
jgi:polysaccharide export outer membrane protein